MSELKGKVGKWQLHWKSAPHGSSGSTHVRVNDGSMMEVRWRKDYDGVWIELPHGVFGFDLQGERDDDGKLRFLVTQRGQNSGAWSGISYLRAGEESLASGEGAKKRGVKAKAQMPGKIVRVLAKAGDSVERDQALVVMEAMKMENEIKAPQAGKLVKLSVTEGQAVETGAELFVIE